MKKNAYLQTVVGECLAAVLDLVRREEDRCILV